MRPWMGLLGLFIRQNPLVYSGSQKYLYLLLRLPAHPLDSSITLSKKTLSTKNLNEDSSFVTGSCVGSVREQKGKEKGEAIRNTKVRDMNSGYRQDRR